MVFLLRRTHYSTLILLMSFAFSSFCQAQVNNSKTFEKYGVKVSIQAPVSVAPSSSFDIDLKIEVPRGFHIYGAKDKTMPSKLSFEDLNGVSVSNFEVPPGTFHRKKGGGSNYWLEGTQEIKATVTLDGNNSREVMLSGKLKFMVCDERSCRPPTDIPFEITVPVKPNSITGAQWQFESPTRIKAAGEFIRTEEPGYASPCLADVNGDGKKDLLVGQFNGGKIKVYSGLGDGKFAQGKWLEAGGKVAEVPGVW